MTDSLIDLNEICNLLGISKATFYRMKAKGEAPLHIIVGGKIKTMRSTIQEFVDKKMQEEEERLRQEQNKSVFTFETKS